MQGSGGRPTDALSGEFYVAGDSAQATELPDLGVRMRVTGFLDGYTPVTRGYTQNKPPLLTTTILLLIS